MYNKNHKIKISKASKKWGYKYVNTNWPFYPKRTDISFVHFLHFSSLQDCEFYFILIFFLGRLELKIMNQTQTSMLIFSTLWLVWLATVHLRFIIHFQISLFTWITLMFRPVSCDSCSRMCLVGFGVAANAAFSVSSCLALMVVRGPRRFPTAPCSSFSLPHASLSDKCPVSESFPSSCGSWESGDMLGSLQEVTVRREKMDVGPLKSFERSW